MELIINIGPEEEDALDTIRKKFKLGTNNDTVRFAILYTDSARWYPDLEWIGNRVLDQMSRIDSNKPEPPFGHRIPPRLRRGVPPKRRKSRRVHPKRKK